jgi:hypothetical protein
MNFIHVVQQNARNLAQVEDLAEAAEQNLQADD